MERSSMWHWFWFNVRYIMLDQIGVTPDDDPGIRLPYEWDWANQEARRCHWNRPWADWYVHVHYYDIVLAEADVPEDQRIPF